MTTKPPPTVNEFPVESLEKIAYTSVSSIPTQEPNDRNRLGHYIWDWLSQRQGTLAQAVKASGARLHISSDEALKIIEESLKKQGVSVNS